MILAGTVPNYFVCPDCGAGRGVLCDRGCPTGESYARDLIEADEDGYEPPITATEVLPGGGWAL